MEIQQSVVSFGDDERHAVDAVLRSGMIVQGAVVSAFEQEFCETVLGGHAKGVAVNSGTSALHLGLIAAGIGVGDEVIVPSFTYAGTVNAIRLTGATPRFCEIDSGSYNASPTSIRSLMNKRTVAILVVHLFGLPVDLEEIGKIAATYKVAIIEDACQAHGALWSGRPVGTFGLFGAFSFYPTKNMTTGEGGLVSSTDAQLLDRVQLLRNQGARARNDHPIAGYNNRMTEIAGAIGRVQVKSLEDKNARRREIAGIYDDGLGPKLKAGSTAGATHVYHQYTVRVGEQRDQIREQLLLKGIGTNVYYPVPCHRLAAHLSSDELPITEKASAEVLSLPMHPYLSNEDAYRVVDALNDELAI